MKPVSQGCGHRKEIKSAVRGDPTYAGRTVTKNPRSLTILPQPPIVSLRRTMKEDHKARHEYSELTVEHPAKLPVRTGSSWELRRLRWQNRIRSAAEVLNQESVNNWARGCPFARGAGALGSLKSLVQLQFRISGIS